MGAFVNFGYIKIYIIEFLAFYKRNEMCKRFIVLLVFLSETLYSNKDALCNVRTESFYKKNIVKQ